VPALTQDLSGISHQLGAPIKALLGVNLLRHIHVTFDRRGDQFIVRREEPAPPPDASRVPLWYVRGGGMVLRAGVNGQEDGFSAMLVDTSALFPVALEDSLWKRAGVDPSTLQAEPSAPNIRSGTVPSLKVGAFDLPKVPGVEGAPLDGVRANVGIDVGGMIGAGLLYLFRVTLADEGRFMWIEPDPTMLQSSAPAGSPPPPPPTRPKAPTPDKPAAKPPAAPSSKPQPEAKGATP
jgi:hypothetical protein